jgi:hypothetical protein
MFHSFEMSGRMLYAKLGTGEKKITACAKTL